MDSTQVNRPTDFTSSKDVVSLSTTDQQAQHYVRVPKVCSISDQDILGSVKYFMELDSNITKTVQEIASNYEQFSLSNIELNIQSGSAMGVSSGMLQFLHIPDPENTNFEPAVDKPSPLNVAKAVRQEGSLGARPRDSFVMKVEDVGPFFTKAGGSPRFSSAGAIVAVVRQVPDAGDIATFQITLTFTYHVFRTTMTTKTLATTIQLTPKAAEIADSNLILDFGEFPHIGSVTACTVKPIVLALDYKCEKSGHLKTIIKKLPNDIDLIATNSSGIFKVDLRAYNKYENIKIVSEPKSSIFKIRYNSAFADLT